MPNWLSGALLAGAFLFLPVSPLGAQSTSPARFTAPGPVWTPRAPSARLARGSPPEASAPAALARDSAQAWGVTETEAIILGAAIGGVALLPVGIHVFRRTQGSPNCLSPFCALPLLGPPLAGAGLGALIGYVVYIHLPAAGQERVR